MASFASLPTELLLEIGKAAGNAKDLRALSHKFSDLFTDVVFNHLTLDLSRVEDRPQLQAIEILQHFSKRPRIAEAVRELEIGWLSLHLPDGAWKTWAEYHLKANLISGIRAMRYLTKLSWEPTFREESIVQQTVMHALWPILPSLTAIDISVSGLSCLTILSLDARFGLSEDECHTTIEGLAQTICTVSGTLESLNLRLCVNYREPDSSFDIQELFPAGYPPPNKLIWLKLELTQPLSLSSSTLVIPQLSSLKEFHYVRDHEQQGLHSTTNRINDGSICIWKAFKNTQIHLKRVFCTRACADLLDYLASCVGELEVLQLEDFKWAGRSLTKERKLSHDFFSRVLPLLQPYLTTLIIRTESGPGVWSFSAETGKLWKGMGGEFQRLRELEISVFHRTVLEDFDSAWSDDLEDTETEGDALGLFLDTIAQKSLFPCLQYVILHPVYNRLTNRDYDYRETHLEQVDLHDFFLSDPEGNEPTVPPIVRFFELHSEYQLARRPISAPNAMTTH
ncbi:hypothetical protein FA15DRAFT_300571 [Coprinopsis marcescibilis]|uniref:F-box domain-containing protein n=1 Tax=Coprinopsis marcescibilis TaxID=230819 RepID=A0A5C3L046_COPMA|nr:hypothetical protein FA15DRAFT_300571 [Coprinopsis marcescibilis]